MLWAKAVSYTHLDVYKRQPPQPYEPAVKRREELFEKEQQEIIEQEKVSTRKETANEKDISQTGQKD